MVRLGEGAAAPAPGRQQLLRKRVAVTPASSPAAALRMRGSAPPPPGGRGGVQVLMVRGFESLLVPEPPGIPERPVTVGRRVFVCF